MHELIDSIDTSSPSARSRAQWRRQAGGTIATVLALLLLASGLLGWNYYRNYQIDQQDEKRNRPFAAFSTKDLDVMAEGYRIELGAARPNSGNTRVATRERFHFGEQVKEFERVQQQTRQVRDRNIQLAQIEAELAQLEAEITLREQRGSMAMVHMKRMFRI